MAAVASVPSSAQVVIDELRRVANNADTPENKRMKMNLLLTTLNGIELADAQRTALLEKAQKKIKKVNKKVAKKKAAGAAGKPKKAKKAKADKPKKKASKSKPKKAKKPKST